LNTELLSEDGDDEDRADSAEIPLEWKQMLLESSCCSLMENLDRMIDSKVEWSNIQEYPTTT